MQYSYAAPMTVALGYCDVMQKERKNNMKIERTDISLPWKKETIVFADEILFPMRKLAELLNIIDCAGKSLKGKPRI